MSYRQTLILAGALLLLAGYIFFSREPDPGEEEKKGPAIWSVEEDQIYRIRIGLPREDRVISFFEDAEKKWRFDDGTGHPVDIGRWGGIIPLVSSYRSKKRIAEKAEDLAEYGLANPQMILTLGVRSLKEPLEIVFGDSTPNQDQIYVKVRQSDPVHMVHHSFCDVLRRLVLEPPLPALIKARASGGPKETPKDP